MSVLPDYIRNLDDAWDALDGLASQAAARDVSMAALALAWVLAAPHVTAPLIAPRPGQFTDIDTALALSLTPTEWEELGALCTTPRQRGVTGHRCTYEGGADGEPDSWGGHACAAVAFDEEWLEIITWGRRQLLSWQFAETQVQKSWALFSPNWFAADKSPSGFDMSSLETDLFSLRAA